MLTSLKQLTWQLVTPPPPETLSSWECHLICLFLSPLQPERINPELNQKGYSVKSDIWSLGITMVTCDGHSQLWGSGHEAEMGWVLRPKDKRPNCGSCAPFPAGHSRGFWMTVVWGWCGGKTAWDWANPVFVFILPLTGHGPLSKLMESHGLSYYPCL